MPTLPTAIALYDVGRSEIQRRQPDLTDFSEGSNLDALTGSGAMLADEVIGVSVDLFADQFFDTAEGQALDDLSSDRFSLDRLAAQPARGTVTFTRGASTGVVTVAAGTVLSGVSSGVTLTYTTDILVQMPSADSTVDAVITCSTTGRAGNLAAGGITKIVTTIPDDPDMTVTNADYLVGGVSAELDPRFRDRLRRYFTTLRKGTVDALMAGAMSVGGVEYATVSEDHIAYGDGGYVDVYVGDPDARANSVLVAAVDTEMLDWRAAGIRVIVAASQREEIVLSLDFTILRGADQSVLLAGVRQAITEYINGIDLAGDVVGGLEVGETLRLSQLLSRGMRVSDSIVGGQVLSHTADIVPSAGNNAIRVLSSDLSITLTEL